MKYVLFPKTELIVARQKPYGHASRMRQYQQHIVVEVETGDDGGFFLIISLSGCSQSTFFQAEVMNSDIRLWRSRGRLIIHGLRALN